MLDVAPDSKMVELLVSVPFLHASKGAVIAVIKTDVLIVLFPLPVIELLTVASVCTIISAVNLKRA